MINVFTLKCFFSPISWDIFLICKSRLRISSLFNTICSASSLTSEVFSTVLLINAAFFCRFSSTLSSRVLSQLLILPCGQSAEIIFFRFRQFHLYVEVLFFNLIFYFSLSKVRLDLTASSSLSCFSIKA